MKKPKLRPEYTLIYTFILLFYLSFIRHFRLLAISGLVIMVGSVVVLTSFKIHRFLLPVLPFLVLMALPMVLSLALTGSYPLWDFQLMVMGKVFLSSVVLGTIIAKYSNLYLVEGVLNLGFPPFLNRIFALTFRYFHMVQQDIQVGNRALTSRGLSEVKGIRMLTVMGHWIGGFFLKSSGHGERVYQAMKARGFEGEIEGKPLLNKGLVASAIGLTAVLLLVLYLDWRLFNGN